MQLVLQYDGSRFAGWQRQPAGRTVQGVMETAVERLFGEPATVLAAGRTDAGVHARGQAARVLLRGRWTAAALRRALNAVLPADVWAAAAHPMRDGFHPRYSAVARRYTYYVGTDEEAASPFRRPFEWCVRRSIDPARLADAARSIVGDHSFVAFAVRGTAPAADRHRCIVTRAEWHPRPGGLAFEIEANRFLHHMVRFLVGTMVDVGTGRRPVAAVRELLEAPDNSWTSPPAPAHGLFLDAVQYPRDLYLQSL